MTRVFFLFFFFLRLAGAIFCSWDISLRLYWYFLLNDGADGA